MHESQVQLLINTRMRRPEEIAQLSAARLQPGAIADLGSLIVVAADHPARGSLGAGDRRLAMADRGDLLARACEALSQPGVNGILGTPDILEDLLILGGLDGKLVFGSMNRAGLAGAAWEIDDRFSAYDAATLAAMRFAGGKMLTRIDFEDPATPGTLAACADAVGQLSSRRLIAMIEPFVARRIDGKLSNVLSTEMAIRASAIAAGLGPTSAYTWLKVPVVENMAAVVAATTLPTLLLGGELRGDQDAFFESWRDALALPNVIGVVVGRSLLYPPDDDVAGAVATLRCLFPNSNRLR